MGPAPRRGFRSIRLGERPGPRGNTANARKQSDVAFQAPGRAALNQALPPARYARAMDESSVTHNRRSRRSPVRLAATVELGGAVHDVKLRKLSSDGALVQGAQDLPENAAITF